MHNFWKQFPEIKIYQYIIMPDHLHFLLHVKERLSDHLGRYIGRFTSYITNQCGCNMPVFEEGYNDRYLHKGRDLNTVFDYIRQNPHRLAIRQNYPQYFQHCRDIVIAGTHFQAYGNLLLLRNPWRQQIIIHRADSDELRATKLETWLENASLKGVAISPFISPFEKAARCEIEKAGGRIILLQNKPLTDRWKPASHDFELCTQWRLLILVPKDLPTPTLTREVCLNLNSLAEKLSKF